MARIVLLGDSLGMPRPTNGVAYEDTYPFFISDEFSKYYVISRYSRARDSRIQSGAQQLNDDVLWLDPDVLCIHLGIVDCAPRLFNKFGQVVLAMLPNPLRELIVGFFSRHRLFFTRCFHKVYVPIKEFTVNIERIITVGCQVNARVIIVGIMMPSERVSSRSFDYEKNVNQYNDVLKNLSHKLDCDFIDVNKLLDPTVHLCEDGIHLNKIGNAVLAKSVIGRIHANL